MNTQGLGRLWLVVAVGVTYLSINMWSYTQQWRIELPSIVTIDADVGKDQKITHGAAVFAVLLLAPALSILLGLTIAFAKRQAALPWAFRLPRIGGLGIDPATATGRRIQGATAIVLLGVPIVAQAHFFCKFLRGTAVKDQVRVSGLSHFVFDRATVLDGKFQYDTLTYFPFVQPWLFLALECVVLALAILAAWNLFRRKLPKA